MDSRQRRGRRGGGPRRSAPDRIGRGPAPGGGRRWSGDNQYRAGVAAARRSDVTYCLPPAVVSGYACGLVSADVGAAGGLRLVALVIVAMFAAVGMLVVARYTHGLLVRTLLMGADSTRFRAWPPTGAYGRPVLALVPNPGNGSESD